MFQGKPCCCASRFSGLIHIDRDMNGGVRLLIGINEAAQMAGAYRRILEELSCGRGFDNRSGSCRLGRSHWRSHREMRVRLGRLLQSNYLTLINGGSDEI